MSVCTKIHGNPFVQWATKVKLTVALEEKSEDQQSQSWHSGELNQIPPNSCWDISVLKRKKQTKNKLPTILVDTANNWNTNKTQSGIHILSRMMCGDLSYNMFAAQQRWDEASVPATAHLQTAEGSDVPHLGSLKRDRFTKSSHRAAGWPTEAQQNQNRAERDSKHKITPPCFL